MKQASPSDVQLLVTMMNEFYAEGGFPLNHQRAAEVFAKLLADERIGYVWFIQANGQDVGYAVLTLCYSMGSPTNAIEDNEFTRAWTETANLLPRPRAIPCISAHWETLGTQATALEQPQTIHDFSGFPPALHAKQYPAPGAPDLARLAQDAVRKTPAALDFKWGLDHGAWSVLCQMFPQADVPVVQLSLDRTQAPAYRYEPEKVTLGSMSMRSVRVD